MAAAVAATVTISAGAFSTASAEEIPPTGPPEWSGMDVRNAPSPAHVQSGMLLGQTPMATRLSVPGAARAIRIHYATPDQHGRPASSTGAVFVPRGAPPQGGWPVIAWAHGTVGLGDNCTPSAQPRSALDSFYISHWLNQGYAVVGTDYVGLGTPGLMSYLNASSEAQSIVDSVKAAHQMGLPLADKWAIVGQSQGAGAAMAGAHDAARLSGGTALDYRGVVATGAPANIEHIVALLGPYETVPLPVGLATYMSYIMAGFSEARPDLHIERVLSPLGRQVVAQARVRCYPEMAEWVPRATGSWFSAPLNSIPGVLGALTAYMGTPVTGYTRPIFLRQGTQDIDVPAASALVLYTQLKVNNQPVQLHVYDTDHSGTVYASIRDSTPFLAAIMR
ncbi:MAG TPA: lipase family protein [Gordonia sp. (in: high G+C Gram-positive bacteria)]|uniref:alpha/beta hydrolase family protein n=1 Tax=Gordonia sp. (in: high G+C Gram-positive bacteria) TaxID=84139 RepID=UPI0025BF6B98|nr:MULTISPECIES: lipase family protein [unclassified Gordonia (in: high G+C Gram-positive bacteria)]HNP58539.1 lipase family protein [Gordonia sp. (in: high G+C Gram-positive bacteria)]